MEAAAALLCPLAVSGGRLASQAGVAVGCVNVFLSPILPLSLKCAASSFPPVVSWSGHSLGFLWLLLHRERG